MTARPIVPPLSVAPMVDRTHRHFRAFFRRLTRRTLLYTEMLTTGAILRGDRARVLGFSPWEDPVALQVGGDDPEALARCAGKLRSSAMLRSTSTSAARRRGCKRGALGRC